MYDEIGRPTFYTRQGKSMLFDIDGESLPNGVYAKAESSLYVSKNGRCFGCEYSKPETSEMRIGVVDDATEGLYIEAAKDRDSSPLIRYTRIIHDRPQYLDYITDFGFITPQNIYAYLDPDVAKANGLPTFIVIEKQIK